jgi:hypothetical protein
VILAAWEAEIGRIAAEDRARQNKFAKPHLNGKKLSVIVHQSAKQRLEA